MDDLRFYVLFNSISVISGRWADDNERLCAMEPRFLFRAEIEKIDFLEMLLIFYLCRGMNENAYIFYFFTSVSMATTIFYF